MTLWLIVNTYVLCEHVQTKVNVMFKQKGLETPSEMSLRLRNVHKVCELNHPRVA